MWSPSSDRGNDRQLVAILDRGVEAAVKTNVFVVQIERDERIRVARVVAESRREGRETGRDAGDDGADGFAVGVENTPVGELGEHGWEMQSYRHLERG